MRLILAIVLKVNFVSPRMLNFAVIMPVWLFSLSVFYFTITVSQFQQSFDSITPSVIHRYLTFQYVDETVVPRMEPTVMEYGIASYFASQMQNRTQTYTLQFTFYQANQIDLCLNNCLGVKIELVVTMQLQTLTLHRHYQLIEHG